MHPFPDLPHIFFPLPAYNFFDEFIMVETNITIKGPDPDFGEFLKLIFIWTLITGNPGTK